MDIVRRGQEDESVNLTLHKPVPPVPGATATTGLEVARVLVVAAVIVGSSCRVAQYVSRQSFWRDESGLLVNVMRYGARELPFRTLDAVPNFTQAAPPLFLLALKGIVNRFGADEYATRFLPMLAGVLSVPLFAAACWRLLPAAGAAWAVWFFAVSDNLIFQSANAKPYGIDVLFTVLLLSVVAWSRPGLTATARLGWAAALTTVLLWACYPIVLVFAAVSLALLPQVIRERRGVMRYLAIHVPVIISFAVVYWFCMRAQRDVHLDDMWRDKFVDYSAPWQIPGWLGGRIWGLFAYCLMPVGGLLILPAIVGAASLRNQRDGETFRLLTLPFALAIAAAALHRYPFAGDRVSLYLVPFELMLAGAGVEAIAAWFPTAPRLAWRVGAASVFAYPVWLAAAHLLHPRSNGDARAAIDYLRAHRQRNQPVYVLLGCSEDYLVYQPRPDSLTHLYTRETTQIRDQPGFWVVMAYKPYAGRRGYGRIFDQPGYSADPARNFHAPGSDAVYLWRR